MRDAYEQTSVVLHEHRADYEGIRAGEIKPDGAVDLASSSLVVKHGLLLASFQQKDNKSRRKIKELLWADNKETQKREYAVTELYPRFSHTFSDVIVFAIVETKGVRFPYMIQDDFRGSVLPQFYVTHSGREF